MASAALELLISLKGDADKQLASLGGSLRDVATTAAGVFAGNLLTSGFNALSGAIQGGIADAREAALIMAQTSQAIISTGGAAGLTAVEIADMAASMSDAAGMSLFGDDLVQSGQNVLLTFTNIGKEVFPLATQAALDMAQATKKSPEAMSLLIGKALNSADAMGALRKQGVAFTDEQIAMGKAMFESGDIIGYQKLVLGELAVEFGGQAKAAADAAGGMVEFNARMGEAAEAAATGFLPVIDTVANVLLSNVMPVIEAAVTTFASFTQGILSAADPMAALGSAVDGALPGFSTFISFLSDNLQPILFGIGMALAVVLVPALISAGIAAAGAVISFGLLLAPLIAIGAAAALLYKAWQTNFGGIQQIVMPVVDAVIQGFGSGGIGGAISGLITSLQTAAPQIGQWLLSVASLIAQNVLTWGQALISWVAPYVTLALQALANFATSIGTWIVGQAPGWAMKLASWGMAFVNWIAPYVSLALTTLANFATSIGTWIVQQAPLWGAKLLSWGQAFIGWVAPMIGPTLAALGSLISAAWSWVQAQAPGWVSRLQAWGQAFVSWIGPAIPPAIAALGALASSFLSWISAQAAPLLASFGVWASSLAAWIPGAITNFLSQWPGMLSQWLNWIGSVAGPLLAKLGTWAITFIQWIAPMIPGFLAALAGIAAAAIVFIGQTAGVLVGKLIEWGYAFYQWVGTEVVPKLPGILQSILDVIGGWISGAVSWIGGELAKVGAAVVSGIQSGISKAWGAFLGWIGDQVAKIPQPIRTALGMGSPSKVMAEQVGLPIVQGIVMGVESGMSLLTGTMTKVGVDITKSAKGAITGIAGAFQNSKLPEAAAAVGRDIIAGWMGGMKENFSAIKGMAAEMGAATVTSLKGSFEIGSPSKLMSREIGIPIVDGITAGINVASPKLSERMLQLGTMLVDLVSKGVDAFGKLRGLGTISLSSITQFASTLQSAMTAFGEMTLRWDKAMMSAASQFTRKSGDVIDLMSKGVEMLGKLKDFEAVPADVFRSFSTALEAAILEIVRISTFANRQLLTHAQSFSEGAAKVIAIIGVGIDALTKLSTLAAPTQGAFQNFANQVSYLVFRMGEVGARMSVDIVAAAAQFSEGAGKVLGLLGTGVDGLMKLQDLTAPLPGTFLRFSEMVGFLVLRMSQVADQFSADAVAAAAKFAEGAGKVLAIVGGGVDAFVKLQDFRAVPEEALGHFANAVHFIVQQFTLIASTFEQEAVAAAGLFSESATKVVATIGAGVEGFLKLASFQAVGEEAMGHFVNAVHFIVQQFTVIATRFSAESIAAASLFADGAGKAVALIGSGVEGFLKLKDFQGVTGEALNLFAHSVLSTLNIIIYVAGLFTAEAIAAATRFADGVDRTITMIVGALEAFKKLGDFQGVAGGVLSSFTSGLISLINEVTAQVFPATVNIGAQMMYGIAHGIQSYQSVVVNAMINAVWAAVNAAQQTLGIASPSKVFEQLIGAQVGAGMARGIVGSTPQVVGATQGLAGAAIGTGGTNNSRSVSVTFAPGSIVVQGAAGQDTDALADAVADRLVLKVQGVLA